MASEGSEPRSLGLGRLVFERRMVRASFAGLGSLFNSQSAISALWSPELIREAKASFYLLDGGVSPGSSGNAASIGYSSDRGIAS